MERSGKHLTAMKNSRWLSRPSISSRTAVDYHGYAVTYNGKLMERADEHPGLKKTDLARAPSRLLTPFCGVGARIGQRSEPYNGSRWSALMSIDSNDFLEAGAPARLGALRCRG